MARDLPNVPVFRAGDYRALRKGVWTRDDVARVAANYSPTVFEAPLTFDHATKGPAFGWVSAARCEDGVLVVDFKGVPEEVYEAWKDGRYKKRSVELLGPDQKLIPVPGPHLTAVTLLGAAPPAVVGLPDVAFSGVLGDAMPEFQELRFSLDVSPPDGAIHGVIVNEIQAGSVLSHQHKCYVDADRNGYTSGPLGSWYDAEPAGEDHKHVVRDGVVLEAGNPPHTHPLTILENTRTGEMFSSKEDTIMPAPASAVTETPAVDPAEVKFSAQINEMAKKNEDAERRLRDAEAELAQLRDQRDFGAIFSSALNDPKGPRVAPSEQAHLFAIYRALGSGEPVKFGANATATSPRSIFEEWLGLRPSIIRSGDAVTGEPAPLAAGAALNTQATPDRETYSNERAQALMKERGLDESHWSALVREATGEWAAKFGADA